MTTPINDFQDILDAIERNPALRDALRRHILTDELLQMPVRLERVEEDIGVIKGDVATLKEGQARLESDVGTLKEDVSRIGGNVSNLMGSDYESHVATYIHRSLRRELKINATVLSTQKNRQPLIELLDRAEGQGNITPEDNDKLNDVDIVLTVDDSDEYILGENLHHRPTGRRPKSHGMGCHTGQGHGEQGNPSGHRRRRRPEHEQRRRTGAPDAATSTDLNNSGALQQTAQDPRRTPAGIFTSTGPGEHGPEVRRQDILNGTKAPRFLTIGARGTGRATSRMEGGSHQRKRKLQVLKPFLQATFIILVFLATLAACSDPTPNPETLDPTYTPAPTAAPTATATATPVPTESQAERPTAAPKATPSSPPTPEPTANPVSLGVPAPLQALDISALLSELSANELACIGDDAGKLVRSLTGPSSAPREEQTRFFGCLEDETVARIFLAGFVPGPEPLSQETSDCVRAAFEVIDPRAVMTAGIEGDPGRAMAGSMAALSVTMACLNDEEWEEAASMTGMRPEEREGMVCLMEALSGPGPMAAAMIAAGEGHVTDLPRAGAKCGLDMGPALGQAPVTPLPAPTATVEAPTPVSTPVPATATSTPVPTGAAPTTTTTLVITVAPITTGIPEYSRSEWKHWEDHDGDCQNARHEVLIAESLVPVTYKTDRKCRVETGRWYGSFTGTYFEDPGDVDVDHMVPLKNAHNSGGWAWGPAMKEEYANNLGDDDHLIAVQDNANQSKGARGPDEWMPPDETYWCQYATDWSEIKHRWDLTMTEPEAEAVALMLGTCEDPPEVVMEGWETLGSRVGEHKPEPTEEPEGSVYGSCEEAESAGEHRFQGSQGGGLGYPKAMVPSARDGDSDGIVCER